MVRKNPAREAALLGYWVKGESVRATAEKSRIPEGSVSRYFARFNKNPEKYHRQSAQTRSAPEENPYLDLRQQVLRAFSFEQTKDRYNRLMSEGNFGQAKLAIEAEMLFDKYVSTKMNGMTLLALYIAAPDKYSDIVPLVAIDEHLKEELRHGRPVGEVLSEVQERINKIPDANRWKDMRLAIEFFKAKYQLTIQNESKQNAPQEAAKTEEKRETWIEEKRIPMAELLKKIEQQS